MQFLKNGDPYGIRTHVAGVRGRSLRPLDQRATFYHAHGIYIKQYALFNTKYEKTLVTRTRFELVLPA